MHKLHYEGLDDVLLVHYEQEQFPHTWLVGPKVAGQWLAHFGPSLEEITMVLTVPEGQHRVSTTNTAPQATRIQFRNHTDSFSHEYAAAGNFFYLVVHVFKQLNFRLVKERTGDRS